MTTLLFGGTTVPLAAEYDDAHIDLDVRKLSRHALVDRFGIDLDRAAILIGPVARKFHGIAGDGDRVGIRPFLDCYHPDARADLADLIEKLTGDGQPFHFTARLAAPAGAFVHGFVAPADAGDTAGGWTGMLVMSRHQARPSSRFMDAC